MNALGVGELVLLDRREFVVDFTIGGGHAEFVLPRRPAGPGQNRSLIAALTLVSYWASPSELPPAGRTVCSKDRFVIIPPVMLPFPSGVR